MSIFIIAEIGINHNGSLDIAKQLIDVAADAGADAVKFQKRTIDLVYSKEMLDSPRENKKRGWSSDLTNTGRLIDTAAPRGSNGSPRPGTWKVRSSCAGLTSSITRWRRQCWSMSLFCE